MAVVEIEILGRRYSLRSERDPAHVRAVAAHVDTQLRELVGGRQDAVGRDHAILVALNIASELFLLREQADDLAVELAARLGRLLDEVERALPSSPTSEASPR
jgi:cell division protein ZapA